MKKICIVTSTRAEYGLLKPIIMRLIDYQNLDIRVVATGTHLSPEFGLTYKVIEEDGITLDAKIEILLSSDTPTAISKTMSMALISFAEYFERRIPDILLVLGDRYETLAISIAAMNQRIPIAHLYGGEITEGAIDDSIRHAISKLSYLHFTSTEEHRRRVIQLGEQPNRVFCIGAMGVENVLNEKLLSYNELEKAIDFKLDKHYAIVTFHPVTLEDNKSAVQFQELLNACSRHRDIKFIFTKANADTNGRIINLMIDKYVEENKNCIAFTSLGTTRYLSSLKYCTMVIGNSSSGLVEAPSFGIPTINIGNRQRGRIQSNSVINCEPIEADINAAINLALSSQFSKQAASTINPYGDGNTSVKVVEIIQEYLDKPIDLKKKFYDYEVD